MRLLYLGLPAAVANMSAPLAKFLLAKFTLSPVDGGLKFRGRPILGAHKTWGGTFLGILGGMLAAYIQCAIDPYFGILSLVDYSNWALIGFLLGTGALAGDMGKSFLKRQFNIKPGQTWVPFDELDFVFGAIIFLSPVYFPGWLNFLLLLALAFIGHIIINLIAFYFNVRKKSEIVTLKYKDFVEELLNKEGRLVVGTIFILFALYFEALHGVAVVKTTLYLLLLFFLIMDYLRVGLLIRIPLYSQWGTASFDRDSIHPVTFGLIGLIIGLECFSFNLVMAGFSMYVYGDSAAAFFGRGFGKLKLFKKKTFEGSVAMFIFSMMAGAFFISNLTLLFVLAIGATIIELFLLRLPDALVLPLAIAMFGSLFERWAVK